MAHDVSNPLRSSWKSNKVANQTGGFNQHGKAYSETLSPIYTSYQNQKGQNRYAQHKRGSETVVNSSDRGEASG
jgi:hypothetical protein